MDMCQFVLFQCAKVRIYFVLAKEKRLFFNYWIFLFAIPVHYEFDS